ncbi:MAG: HU family DNA-binding protein [Verrucomicrobia bacterium]|nr:HU family DNA-binding protein [Verrucomicrobiota bacterium]
MTSTKLQKALAAATGTDAKTAAVFLNALTAITYQTVREEGQMVLPGLGKVVKHRRKIGEALNPMTRQRFEIRAGPVLEFRFAKMAKEAILGPAK